MAFRRRIRERRHQTCGIYGCEQRATETCSVCERRMCKDCYAGHLVWHRKRELEASGVR